MPPTGRPRRHPDALLRERQRVAQLLHDTICQELTGIELFAHAAARQHRDAAPEAGRQFAELATLLGRATQGLTEIMRSLRAEGPDASP